MRVLIVAHDAAERQRAATALTLRQDVEITECETAHEATTQLRDGGIDVLVVDGDLQPKGGFSWLYELREQGELTGVPRPPAIVMTARPQDQFLADWSGAQAVVTKPVDPFVLARRIDGLVGPAVAPASASDQETAAGA